MLLAQPYPTPYLFFVTQIAQLFLSPIGGDGLPVLESTTGAYAVKISVDGKWQVVIVDDFFPALEASKANNENRGVAVGHSYGARELWVSLLEKVNEIPTHGTETGGKWRPPGKLPTVNSRICLVVFFSEGYPEVR